MPMYMDIRDVPGVTPETVANAHLEDLKVPIEHHNDLFGSLKGFDQPVHVHCIGVVSNTP
jgi:hypothetical protein